MTNQSALAWLLIVAAGCGTSGRVSEADLPGKSSSNAKVSEMFEIIDEPFALNLAETGKLTGGRLEKNVNLVPGTHININGVVDLPRDKTIVTIDRVLSAGRDILYLGSGEEQSVSNLLHWISDEKGFVYGSFRMQERLFRMRASYGSDSMSILEIDNKFLDHDESKLPSEPGSSMLSSEAALTDSRQPASAKHRTTISVLVAYTDDVVTGLTSDKLGSVESFIQLAMASTQKVFDDSRIFVDLELAGILALNPTKGVDTWDSVAAIQFLREKKGSSLDVSGVWDEVFLARSKLKADVVIVLTDSLSSCGRGHMPAQKETAFAVVKRACAIDNFSLAHELGHLLGANHNAGVTGFNTGFNYGICQAGSYRTIMSEQSTDCHPPRIGYFSSKVASADGVIRGSAKMDNVGQINSYAPVVAAFSDQPDAKPTSTATPTPQGGGQPLPSGSPMPAPTVTPGPTPPPVNIGSANGHPICKNIVADPGFVTANSAVGRRLVMGSVMLRNREARKCLLQLKLGNEAFTKDSKMMLVQAKQAVPPEGVVIEKAREIQVVVPKVTKATAVNGRIWFGMAYLDPKGNKHPLVTYRVTL